MKLSEFINDDTCQILLAIIIGIVICYFIFGQGIGSCNRDGFSVGAPCMSDSVHYDPICDRLLTEDSCEDYVSGEDLYSRCQWIQGPPPAPGPVTPPAPAPVTPPAPAPAVGDCVTEAQFHQMETLMETGCTGPHRDDPDICDVNCARSYLPFFQSCNNYIQAIENPPTLDIFMRKNTACMNTVNQSLARPPDRPPDGPSVNDIEAKMSDMVFSVFGGIASTYLNPLAEYAAWVNTESATLPANLSTVIPDKALIDGYMSSIYQETGRETMEEMLMRPTLAKYGLYTFYFDNAERGTAMPDDNASILYDLLINAKLNLIKFEADPATPQAAESKTSFRFADPFTAQTALTLAKQREEFVYIGDGSRSIMDNRKLDPFANIAPQDIRMIVGGGRVRFPADVNAEFTLQRGTTPGNFTGANEITVHPGVFEMAAFQQNLGTRIGMNEEGGARQNLQNWGDDVNNAISSITKVIQTIHSPDRREQIRALYRESNTPLQLSLYLPDTISQSSEFVPGTNLKPGMRNYIIHGIHGLSSDGHVYSNPITLDNVDGFDEDTLVNSITLNLQKLQYLLLNTMYGVRSQEPKINPQDDAFSDVLIDADGIVSIDELGGIPQGDSCGDSGTAWTMLVLIDPTVVQSITFQNYVIDVAQTNPTPGPPPAPPPPAGAPVPDPIQESRFVIDIDSMTITDTISRVVFPKVNENWQFVMPYFGTERNIVWSLVQLEKQDIIDAYTIAAAAAAAAAAAGGVNGTECQTLTDFSVPCVGDRIPDENNISVEVGPDDVYDELCCKPSVCVDDDVQINGIGGISGCDEIRAQYSGWVQHVAPAVINSRISSAGGDECCGHPFGGGGH